MKLSYAIETYVDSVKLLNIYKNTDLNKLNKYGDRVERHRKYLQSREARHVIEEYYTKIFEENLTERYRLVSRLKTSLNGFYYEAIQYGFEGTILDFADSKRPYGNKNISASIIFQLGVDIYNILTVNDMIPESIEMLCMKLHNEVIDELEGDQHEI